MSDDFSLHTLASEIIRDNKSPDPADIAVALLAAIDPSDLEASVLLMAREYVRSVIGSMRHNANRPTTATGSKKVAAARDQWRRLLDIPEYVSSLGGWIKLSDATRLQVLEMASYRMEQAHKNAAAAKRYEHIAKSMKTLRVERVGDLPEDLLLETLQPKGIAA